MKRFAVALAAMVACASATHYEDPSKGCANGEMAVRVQGMKGGFCAPTCQGSMNTCPQDAPSGSAKGQCVLQTQGGSKYCGLVCTPGQSGQCPTGAQCEQAPGSQVGLCMYTDASKEVQGTQDGASFQEAGFPVSSAPFEEWKQFFGKSYSGDEENKRREIYAKNAAKVAEHNARGHSWWMTLNENADLTEQEFTVRRGLLKQTADYSSLAQHQASGAAPQVSVDWRSKNLVTPVKNQGQCGSCWAFSTVVSIEGQHAKSTNKLVSLSEENLVDCVTGINGCCNGCQGGLMVDAMQYLVKNQGGKIDTESSYPYTAGGGQSGQCSYQASNSGATITGFTSVKQGDEAGLLDAASSVGPISIGVDASNWQMYGGGVYSGSQCSSDPSSMDHGVAVVGYGEQDGKKYWIVKNSWGGSWGEQGYIRVERGVNACGVANAAVYPTGVSAQSEATQIQI